MTDVTRIACPGCRGLLRFEPEALDFPANCGGCECRFEVQIQVRVTCPKCHSKSKIPDNARDYQIRCGRCQHEYLGHDGIAAGGGGRLLVARMLDTDSPNPPETVQPYVGHAREEAERKANAPSVAELERLAESERLKAEAIAERDRMVHETGLFKALLARLVSSPPGDLSNDPGLTEALHSSLDGSGTSKIREDHASNGSPVPAILGPGERSDLATLRLVGEKSRLEETISELRNELEFARSEVSRHGGLVADQIALADREAKARHQAEKKLLKLRADLERAQTEAENHRNLLESELPAAKKAAESEKQAAEKKIAELQRELGRAKAETEEHRNRLSRELALVQKASEEANNKLKVVEEKLAQSVLAHQEAERTASRMVVDHGKALFEAEQERNALSMTIERLTQAVISARTGEEEALDRLEEYANGLMASDEAMANELNAERQRNIDLGQIVDSLNEEIDSLRHDHSAKIKAREAEVVELKRRFEEDRQLLAAEVERTRAQAEDAASQLAEVHQKLEASTTLAEELRAAALALESKRHSELSQFQGSDGHDDPTYQKLIADNKRLAELTDRMISENRRLERIDEEASALRLENQHLGQAAAIARQECQRLSEVVSANLLENQRQADTSGEVQRLKQENDRLQIENRRMAALSELPGSPKLQNQKLADAIETSELLHLDNVRLSHMVEASKAEMDRRQKSLFLEIQRIKQEYEKLVGANERLVDRVQQLLDEKMAVAESAHITNGIKPLTANKASALDRPLTDRRSEPSALDHSMPVVNPASRTIGNGTGTALSTDSELLPPKLRDAESRRDLAFSMHYEESTEEQ